MKAKNILFTIVIPTILSCTSNPTVKKQVPAYLSDARFQVIVKDTFSRHITDENKIIEFNKIKKKYGYNIGNYVIIDKKECQAKVYDATGKKLYQTDVALGRDIGDKRGCGYKQKGVELRAYTPPGEYTVSREGAKAGSSNERLYGNEILILSGDHTKSISKGKQTLALHRVPKTPMGKLREKVLKNKTIKDNRVSFGCVNFLVNKFHEMRSFISGKNTKVYILPEEQGNSLYLEQQANGEFKFFQKKYRYESQE